MPKPHDWLRRFVESAPVHALMDALRADRSAVAAGGRGSSTALLAGAVAAHTHKPVLLVVAHLDEADDALDDLETFTGAGYDLPAERFGALEVLPGESALSLDLLAERLAIVDRLQQNDTPPMLVAPIQAVMQSVPAGEAMHRFALPLKPGMDFPMEGLIDWLDGAGYVRQDMIEQPGDFAVRGGLIDIFLPTDTGPVRLDFFGDEVESIHRIDAETMGSLGTLDEARLIGATAEQMQNDEGRVCMLDLLPEDCTVVLAEPMELTEQARGYYERLTNPKGIFSPNQVLHRLTQKPHVEVQVYAARTQGQATELPTAPLPAFETDAAKAIRELGDLAADHEVVVVCQKDGEASRLRELLEEYAPDVTNPITIELGYLHRGFVWGDPQAEQTVVLPHHELFHRYETRRRVRRVTADVGAGAKASDAFLDLEPGDAVVHVDHGIARFTGLKTLKRKLTGSSESASQEFLTLEFAERAVLHVPATQIDLIQKYVGGFQGQPPLSVLGGKRWKKQKQDVADAVKDLAKELLQVQAARATQPGIRYPGDTAWQKEFEAEFPYTETEDQLSAIAGVKKDMAAPRPMDRLICGDVGFGKTEVAIRAAFKACEYGKQVAVLVPTTVLAEQHAKTFAARFADYPFRVESLSRFKTGAEARTVIKDLAAGRVDVVIGTHRLLSKDVKFKDLGLVVIDEEQRFGVEHKNSLLALRLTADVLTMTATPIPRTLHMSMIGLRDISSLSTPPVDRRAVVTETIPYDNQRIKQAIIREMSRDGQCYFVHNRVHNIHAVASEIQSLAPDAKIVVGHGQMSPRELEKVMLAFTRREADILVSTTIIESGIDIPTANTMFINQADHFGLAELHQLRGRVGRYKHRAYCYLLLPPDRPINEVATRRLRALEQYAMLGAGFKIAMRDLEIRGAGNLLGSEQSGHIAAVGYEMYCLLLEQQTRKLKNEAILEPCRTHLELPLAGALPKRYITSDKFRMELYRRLSRATSQEQLDAICQAMTDAYGPTPAAAQRLIDLTQIRIAASRLGIDKLQLEGPDLIFTVRNTQRVEPVFAATPGRATTLDKQTIYWRPPANYLQPPETLLAVLRKLLVTSPTQA